PPPDRRTARRIASAGAQIPEGPGAEPDRDSARLPAAGGAGAGRPAGRRERRLRSLDARRGMKAAPARAAAIALVLGLAACGTGGGEDQQNLANEAQPQTVDVPQTVTAVAPG